MATDKKLIQITGRVIDRKTKQGLSKLRVEAWDKDLIVKNAIGSAATDQQGAFVIETSKGQLNDLFATRHVLLFFKVFRDAQLIASTEASVLWDRDAPDSELVIKVTPDTPTPVDTGQAFTVRGQVRRADGNVFTDGIVQAFITIQGQQQTMLGEAKTDGDGQFEIAYTLDASQVSQLANARVVVRALDSQRNQLAESPSFIPDTSVTVNLTVPNLPPPLQQTLSVRGQIRSKDGSPVAGAIVRAFITSSEKEIPIGETQTDSTGNYVITATVQSLTTQPAGALLEARVFDKSNTMVGASSSPLQERVSTMDVVADFPEPGKEWCAVSGQVLQADGKPLSSGIVRVYGAFPTQRALDKASATITAVDDGRFRIEYQPAEFSVRISEANRIEVRVFRVVDNREQELVQSPSSPVQFRADEEQFLVVHLGDNVDVPPVPAKTFTVEGYVRKGGQPLGNVTVKAFDGSSASSPFRTVQSSSDSSNLGHYLITYLVGPKPSDFTSAPSLVIRAFDGSAAGESVLGRPAGEHETMDVIIPVLPPPGDFFVEGRVLSGAQPIEGVFVQAIDWEITGRTVLGTQTTLPDGSFHLSYHLPAGSVKQHADLLIRVFTRDANNVETDLLVPPLFIRDATPHLTLDDIDIPGLIAGPSEYEVIANKVTLAFPGLNPADWTDDGVELVARTTDLDLQLVAFYAAAAALTRRTAIMPEAHYAFLREGLPGNVTALLSQDPLVLRGALQQALDANIIPQRLRSKIDVIIDQVQQAIIAEAFRTGDTGLASLASLLATVITSPDRQREFVTLYLAHTGTIEQFWDSLRTNNHFGVNVVNDLQFAIQAGALTGNHIPLVRKLQQMRAAHPPQITALSDLAKKTQSDWENIIRQSGTPLTFPPGVAGNNENERVTNYARILSTIVADAFPTAVISARFAIDTGLNVPNKADAVKFFSNNSTFELGSTNIRRFIGQSTTNLSGITDRAGLTNRLEAMQRINKLAPSYDDMSVLMSSGFDSAAGIARLSKQTFVNQYSAQFGARAAAIFDNATQVAATAANLFADLQDRFSGAGPIVLPIVTPEDAGIPDWTTLFGPIDFCECTHCRSVLSPAAYLVDTLHFLRDRRGIDSAHPGVSALDVLFSRRPDIGDIELTCENTNTLVRYVDLLIEALNPATGSTPEARLLALFTLLSNQTYPWLLPFNQAAEQTRAYLELAGVHRYDLMRTFQSFTTVPASDGGFSTTIDPDEIAITTEYLGMTTLERKVIDGTATQPTWALWGYAASSGLLDAMDGVQHVRKLLDRSGLSHAELVDLVDTHYINPNPNALIDIKPDTSCNIDEMTLTPLDQPALGRIVRFVRLWRKLGWTMHEVDLAITAVGAGRIDETNLAYVLRVRAVLNLKVDQVLALWSLIDTEGEDSLYNRLFLNKRVSDPVDAAFQLNTQGSELATPGVLNDHIPAILAALRVSTADLDLIRTDAGLTDALNLANLSMLYRYSVLSRSLSRLSISDLIALKTLSGIDPFLHPPAAKAFIEMFEKVRASGFKIAELKYLLRGESDAASQVAPKDDGIALVLDEIRKSLQKIASETAEASDPSGEILAKKLASLGVDAKLIDSMLGLLGGSQVQTAEFIPLPETPPFADQFKAKLANEPALGERISYDPAATQKQLSFTGAMTVAERQTLSSLFDATFSSLALYQTAIDALFVAPRDFITARLKYFVAPSAVVSFEGPPPAFPADLQMKVSYDANAKELRFTGEMTAAEKTSLLALSSSLPNPTADAYETAINALSLALEAPSNDPNNLFLNSTDVDQLFDLISPGQHKFELVLARINAYLRRTSSESLIKQKVAEALKLDAKTTEQLMTAAPPFSVDDRRLRSPAHPSENPIHEFLDAEFIGSTVKITRAAPFLNQFDTFILLHKVALIVSKFKITPRQLDWLFDYGLSAGWLDLNSLASASATNPASFSLWSRLVDLFALRDRLRNGEETLSTVFALSREPSPPVTPDDLLAKLSEMTGWDLDDLKFLDGPTGLALSISPTATNPKFAYTDEQALTRLSDCFSMMRRLGVSARQCRSWAAADMTPLEANAARQAAKAKFDDEAWTEADQPISEGLSEKLRAALVSYMVAHPDSSKHQTWKDSNGLYDYFLIDPEMSPCMLTSRIKQAISSVQLFVQRCLMNLESGVKASAENDTKWRDWKWMKSYRIWEANRKVFLYPENWVEPELRDDKSPFFKDLENELLQNHITKDTAETAFIHYLEKLDEVARLEVAGMYHQFETDAQNNPEIDIWHVFARTSGTPPIYYYRQWVNASYWTAWDKVDVDIEGNHLVPVVWNGRLFLLWPVFTKETVPTPVIVPEPKQPIADPISFWKIKLAWSQLKNQKWSSKKISKEFLEAPASDPNGRPSSILPDLTQFFFQAPTPDPVLVVQCDVNTEQSDKVSFSKELVGEFRFDECNNEPAAIQNTSTPPARLLKPRATAPENMALVERPVPNAPTSFQEPVVFVLSGGVPRTDELYVPDEQGTDKAVLVTTPGTFRLLLPQQVYPYRSKDPFFFYDSMKTYFVIPKTNRFRPVNLGNINQVNPKAIDDIGQRYFKPFAVSSTFAPSSARRAMLNSLGSATEVQSPSIIDVTSRSTVVERAALSTANLNLPTGLGNVSIGSILNDGLSVKFVIPGPKPATKYLFNIFYHPYVCLFIKNLSRKGIDGLLERSTQTNPPTLFDFNVYLKVDSQPSRRELILDPLPREEVDFSFGGAYSQYNWELFFHAPFEIAVKLTQNQRFEEAQKWFHYIFDPTSTSDVTGSPGDPKTRRYWQTKPFFERMAADYDKQRIEKLLNPADATANSDLIHQINQWLANPFNPHAIARLRGVAYQKTVVMKYLDNLIEWGDQLFSRDTIESINEATQLYILAAEILGPRPQEIHPRREPAPHTYTDLALRLDAFSNALENLSPAPVSPSTPGAPLPLPLQVFCIPKNDKLLGYWDTVADRLFKIRHCENIEGVVRQLALFEPPIDPALLVRAAAAGVDLSSALSDVNAASPHYRFNVMAPKATELCGEVRALGAALLSALEKRDAEAIALLRSSQEMEMLGVVRQVKERQIDEAIQALEGLRNARELASIRKLYYETRSFMNSWETTHMTLSGIGLGLRVIETSILALTGTLHLIPNLKLGAPTSIGVTFGGDNVAESASKFQLGISKLVEILDRTASLAATQGGYHRRQDDWNLQKDLAAKEIEQMDKQITAAEIRVAIAERELANHDLQIQHAKQNDAFMHDKFTNQELYDWMVGQVSAIYFQSYKLAYDVAKRSERAFRFELALDDSSFIQFGYWDSLKKGLLAGERLSHDLKRMEIAYLDQNKREYELTKHISLVLLDPIALIKLKETGRCFVNLDESLFDMDYPGHYMRRIKSVALTIPCVTGPYTSVNCTLTLLKNSLRSKATASGEYARDESDPSNTDSRFRDSVGAIQSIATSSGQNDSGLFELNFRDERYLPFEGAGAISTWQIELPKDTNAFDFDTISDVVLQLRYTARDGGAALRTAASDAVKSLIAETANQPLARLFSMRHEFPGEWHRFLTSTGSLQLDLKKDHFPFRFRGRLITITIKALKLFLNLSADSVYDDKNPLRLTVGASPELSFTISPVLGVPFCELTGQTSEIPTRLAFNGAGPLTKWEAAVEDLWIVCEYSVS